MIVFCVIEKNLNGPIFFVRSFGGLGNGFSDKPLNATISPSKSGRFGKRFCRLIQFFVFFSKDFLFFWKNKHKVKIFLRKAI